MSSYSYRSYYTKELKRTLSVVPFYILCIILNRHRMYVQQLKDSVTLSLSTLQLYLFTVFN
jgi:hypothetical protein